MHKEFRGGVSKGVLGWGLRSNFGAPFLYVLCAFLGLDLIRFSQFDSIRNAALS